MGWTRGRAGKAWLLGAGCVLASAASAGACAQIAGIEDWTLGEPGSGSVPHDAGAQADAGMDPGAEAAADAGAAEVDPEVPVEGASDVALEAEAADGGEAGADSADAPGDVVAEPVCDAGQTRCSSNALQDCNADRSGWDTVATCATSALCDAAKRRCNLGLSCLGGGSGAGKDCGALASADCCAVAYTEPGTFLRSYDAVSFTDKSYPATVGAVGLSVYEVTVGRFRKFLGAGLGTQLTPPPADAGAHPKVAASGWQSSWNPKLAPSMQALQDGLRCHADLASFAPAPAANERHPINCVTWYEAFAFCAWDGGRLATEAEWNLAAAGGAEQRVYPWSQPPASTAIDETRAAYNCAGDGNPGTCAAADLLVVGSRSPAGDARWAHADLAGNLAEWVLDVMGAYAVPCADCASVSGAPGAERVVRGGGYDSTAAGVLAARRLGQDPSARTPRNGIRCATLF
jgi:formylglycine-generating enzyme required for sulfatase activity